MSSVALKFKIFDEKGTQILPLAKPNATIGSAAHCDVVFKHPTVQAEHARAWCEGGRIWIQDLGTTHGTTLNGIRLPPLKPMLVRELDIVRLGDCAATMGVEPNVVRAPVVVPENEVPDITVTDIRPLVAVPPAAPPKNNEGDLHRELAELKLQLQMARLDGGQGDSAKKELAAANKEIQRLKDSFRHIEGDKKNFKSQFENEVAELKLKALRDLKEQREQDQRKFEIWKMEAAGQLASAVKTAAEQKTKGWNQRPVTKEFAHELDGEMKKVIRRVLLNEESSGADAPAANAKATSEKTSSTSTSRAKTAARRKPRPGGEDTWHRIAVGGLVVAALIVTAWFAANYLKKDGTRALASQPVQTVPGRGNAPVAAPVPASAQVAAAHPDAGKTSVFKKTYTDNVLGTLNYVDAELNMDFRALWLKDFGRVAVKEWKLDQKTVNDIAGKEILLIQDLNRLKTAPAQMRQRESQFMQELQQRLGKKITTDKFMRLKRAFYTRNQVYLTRETR